MMLRRLEATVRHQSDVAIIDLQGEINAFAEDSLNAAYREAADGNEGAVLLNFALR